MDSDTHAALTWIVSSLRQHRIPFEITGGLAAKAYGAERALFDIDISVPAERLVTIGTSVSQYIVFGPSRFMDQHWDLDLLRLKYRGVEIDVGAAECRVYDSKSKTWQSLSVDFSQSSHISIDGLIVPVTPKSALIAYKQILSRPCDLDDIAAIDKGMH